MSAPLPRGVDLDSTERCDQDDQCEGCSNSVTLEVVTLETAVGVLCATLCRNCVDAAELGTVPVRFRSFVAASERVCAHCGHLGIDLDQMAALMAAGNGGTQ